MFPTTSDCEIISLDSRIGLQEIATDSRTFICIFNSVTKQSPDFVMVTWQENFLIFWLVAFRASKYKNQLNQLAAKYILYFNPQIKSLTGMILLVMFMVSHEAQVFKVEWNWYTLLSLLLSKKYSIPQVTFYKNKHFLSQQVKISLMRYLSAALITPEKLRVGYIHTNRQLINSGRNFVWINSSS